jgi:hypothetical protein
MSEPDMTREDEFSVALHHLIGDFASAMQDDEVVLREVGLAMAHLLASIAHNHHMLPDEVEQLLDFTIENIRAAAMEMLNHADRHGGDDS